MLQRQLAAAQPVHKDNKARMKASIAEGRTAPAAEEERPQREGDPLNDNLKQGYHFFTAHDYARAAKYFRRDIKANPDTPEGYLALAKTRCRSGDFKGSTEVRLEALQRCKVGSAEWAEILTNCIAGLSDQSGAEIPKPSWWNDTELLSLTKQVLAKAEANAENEPLALVWALHTRARVLANTHERLPGWSHGLRTPLQYIEAVKCYERAAQAADERHAAGDAGMGEGPKWADDAKCLRAHLNSVMRGGPPNPHEVN